MSPDDVIHRFRLRVFALAGELGNVRAACRHMGIHPSTYYRWANNVETWGLEALRPRERRRPRMPNQLPEWVEHRILAFSLAHPGLGPKRIAAELARDRWGALRVSPNGTWRCLSRHGLGHRRARLSLVAGYAAPPEPERASEAERHLDAPYPGALVDGLLLRRTAFRHQRRLLAVHGDRRALGVHVGRAAHDGEEPRRKVLLGARPPRRRRSRPGRLAPRGRHDGQWQRVPQRGVHGHHHFAWGPTPPDPCGQTDLERRR